MNRFRALFKLFRTRLEYTRTTSEVISFLLMIFGILIAPFSRSKAAHWLMLSHRNTFSPARQKQREYFLGLFGLFDSKIIDRILPQTEHNDDSIFEKRVITLKELSGEEKGVILLKFLDTYTWLRANHDVERLLRDYYIVFEMSYYGCCCPELLQYASYDHSCVVSAAQPLENGFLNRLNRNLIAASFAPCCWVDDRTFFPTTSKKEFDAIYVATWNPVKRHHILFEAVSRIADPSFRAVLVGGGYGGTRYEMEQWVRYYGVEDRVVIMENMPHEEINILLGKCRYTVMFSLKEGGNKAIIEGMFANIPCLVLDDHIGFGVDWINDLTGCMVSRRDLPSSMMWMRDNWQSFSPREWAMANLHPRMTTAKIEKVIREISEDEGRGWTKSLAVKYNRGSYLSFYDESAPRPTAIDLHSYRKKSSQLANTSTSTPLSR